MWYPILIAVLVSYALGNLNGAVLMSNLFAHEDVRSHGSGNAGLTNFARNYGGIGSVCVILIDGAKAALACLLGGLLLKPYGMPLEGMTIGGLSVMVGHIFPMLLGFKGGKGILSGCIIAFVVDWRIGAIALAVFATLYLTTQYVSLGSIFGTIALCAGFVVFHHDNLIVMICGVVMGSLALFMHHKNIRRLIKGEESKTNLFRKGKKK